MTFPLSRLRWLVLAATSVVSSAAWAQSGAWCADQRGGGSNCSFKSLAQCQATISGVGGLCRPRPGAAPVATGRGPAARREAAGQTQKSRRITVRERRRMMKEEMEARIRQQKAARAAAAARRTPPSRAGSGPAASVGAAPAAAAVNVTTVDVSAVPALDRDDIRKVQLALREKGFDPGASSGTLTERTRAALRGFQERFGLKASGEIDNQTLLALGQPELAGR